MNTGSIESMIIRNKKLIERTFEGKVNLDNMNLGDVIDLTRAVYRINSANEVYVQLVKENPELINGFLRIMGENIKYIGREYNEYRGEENKVIFSGLLGKSMRELKQVGATQ